MFLVNDDVCIDVSSWKNAGRSWERRRSGVQCVGGGQIVGSNNGSLVYIASLIALANERWVLREVRETWMMLAISNAIVNRMLSWVLYCVTTHLSLALIIQSHVAGHEGGLDNGCLLLRALKRAWSVSSPHNHFKVNPLHDTYCFKTSLSYEKQLSILEFGFVRLMTLY